MVVFAALNYLVKCKNRLVATTYRLRFVFLVYNLLIFVQFLLTINRGFNL